MFTFVLSWQRLVIEGCWYGSLGLQVLWKVWPSWKSWRCDARRRFRSLALTLLLDTLCRLFSLRRIIFWNDKECIWNVRILWGGPWHFTLLPFLECITCQRRRCNFFLVGGGGEFFFAGGPLLTCEDYKTQAKVTCSKAAFVKKCLAYYNMRNSRNAPPKNSPKFSVGMITLLKWFAQNILCQAFSRSTWILYLRLTCTSVWSLSF